MLSRSYFTFHIYRRCRLAENSTHSFLSHLYFLIFRISFNLSIFRSEVRACRYPNIKVASSWCNSPIASICGTVRACNLDDPVDHEPKNKTSLHELDCAVIMATANGVPSTISTTTSAMIISYEDCMFPQHGACFQSQNWHKALPMYLQSVKI